METKYDKFTTREEYLAFRAEWKAEYKALSQEIRDIKFALHSYWPIAEPEKFKKAEEIRDRYNYEAFDYTLNKKRMYRQDLNVVRLWRRIRAHTMLEELACARILAQTQYLASHPQPT